MKKSINAWSIDPNSAMEEMFRDIREAGFEGIELNVDDNPKDRHALSMRTTDADLAEVLALSKKYDLPVGSISTSLWGRCPMGDPSQADNGRALLEQQLRCAKALGATGILTVPAGHGEKRTLREAWENSVQFLRDQRELIHRYGIAVGVENVWNAFFTSAFDMVKFLDEVDDPLVQAYYDVGNVAAFSDTENWIDILRGRICKIHIKDYRRNNGSINTGGTFVDVTEGSINWKKVIPALKKAGYDGYLTAEVSKADPQLSYKDYYRLVSRQEDQILTY